MTLDIERTDDYDWEGLCFTLFLVSPVPPDQQDRLRNVILAWYTIGVYGGLGDGVPHFISDIGFEVEDGQHIVEWWVDMGSLEPEALDVLIRCLDRFVQLNEIKTKRLVLGRRLLE
jgi:hypothetical protein